MSFKLHLSGGHKTLIDRASDTASKRFLDLFTHRTAKLDTRAVYAQAVEELSALAEKPGYSLRELEPALISTYFDLREHRLVTVFGKI